MSLALPRYVIAKPLKGGGTGFYFNVPSQYRAIGCRVRNEPLGSDYSKMLTRATALNETIDEWLTARRGTLVLGEAAPRFGTVDWLFREYKASDAYLKKVGKKSRSGYERAMKMVSDTLTKQGDRVGGRLARTITPRGADKLCQKFYAGPKGHRPRQAEKAVILCRKAWRVVHRLFPEEFDRAVPNPWTGVTLTVRTKATKPAATRDDVYAFAWGCIEAGEVEAAASAVICFEWLQRPENVIEGHIRWTDYRGAKHPNAIRIFHHKTGAVVLHPLEEITPAGVVRFYEDAEAVLAQLPKRGVPMILRQVSVAPDGTVTAKPYALSSMQHVVQRMRKRLGLPSTFTLDACRHGGLTELEEAELTDGQGRALSAHRTQQSYEGYAKRTMSRALSATRKRHAHLLAARSEQPKLGNDFNGTKTAEIQNRR